MPNSDTWPRAVSVETLSNMDSARSCDSVISVNSACSEDSMEHLSAEEKACLMYLEETIESLDLQEDSGFSNDEPDPANLRRTRGGSETLPEPVTCSNILSVMAVSGSGKTEASYEPDNPVSDPQFFALDICDPPSHIPPDPRPAAPGSASGSATPVPAPLSTELSLSSDGESQTSAAEAGLPAKASGDVDLSFIPPPSDFMDEPVPPSPLQMDSGATSPAPKTTMNLEVLRRRMSEKNIPVSTPLSPVSPTPVNSSPVMKALAKITSVNPAPISPVPVNSLSISPAPVDLAPLSPTHPSPAPQEKLAVELPAPLLSNLSSPQTEASLGPAEPKSPPAVAPKPKKLPPNIILKSHKSTAGYESTMGHPSPGTTDRLLMDPQKVRMEALRKLGLLKSEELDSGGPASKPLQSRRPWAPASSPLSPTPPKSAPPSLPCTSSVHSSPVHTPVPASAQTASVSPQVQSEALPDIIPVPAAFSDPVKDMFVGVSDKSSPPLDKKLSSFAVKSATLERSGLGLSSYMESLEQDKQTLGQLRNSRPRPASLGSGKDFSGARGVASSETERERPAPSSSQLSDSSQKLPRSQGISVVICPRGQSEESRREALKKLGLLRD